MSRNLFLRFLSLLAGSVGVGWVAALSGPVLEELDMSTLAKPVVIEETEVLAADPETFFFS